MNKESNTYIFIYAAVLVVIVAILLSAANVFLKPYQDKNARIEKMENILTAANITIDKDADIEQLFNEHCVAVLGNKSDGNSGNQVFGSLDHALAVDMKSELYKKSKGETFRVPVFVIDDKAMVIPMSGNGLWGQIWGYLALDREADTVIGVVFDHKSETPGLGGEIVKPKFSNQFIGKTVVSNGRLVPLKVRKGGIGTLAPAERCHAVDAISGATITSTGVEKMLNEVFDAYNQCY